MRYVTLCVVVLTPSLMRADGRSAVAREVAEAVVAKWGAKAAAKGVPALAARLEAGAARFGPETFAAVRKVGPQALELAEAAGVHGSKAVRVLAVHGEAGATCVLKNPRGMSQFLKHGDEAAVALVRHPGIADKVIEKAGEPAVKALAAISPQNGRRVSMLLEGEVGKAAKTPELLEVIAKYGDRAAAFAWDNKVVLAGGAVLTAFVMSPEPYLNGTRDIAKVAGDTTVGVADAAGKHIAAPVLGGLFSAVNCLIGVVAVAVIGAVALMWKFGVPRPEAVRSAWDAARK